MHEAVAHVFALRYADGRAAVGSAPAGVAVAAPELAVAVATAVLQAFPDTRQQPGVVAHQLLLGAVHLVCMHAPRCCHDAASDASDHACGSSTYVAPARGQFSRAHAQLQGQPWLHDWVEEVKSAAVRASAVATAAAATPEPVRYCCADEARGTCKCLEL